MLDIAIITVSVFVGDQVGHGRECKRIDVSIEIILSSHPEEGS